jgi:transmembrane sensor
MQHKSPVTFNEQIYQEACEWFVEFRSGELDATSRRRFDDWARKSPEHLAAYLEIAAVWNEGLTRDSGLKWDTQTLIAQAAAENPSIVPLQERLRQDVSATALPDTASRRETHVPRARTIRSGQSAVRPFRVAASIAVIGLIVGALIWYRELRTTVYATTFGEERSITLADGSVIDINSHSKIRVRYTGQERDVELLEGQALFHVAKNPTRPFIVSSGATQVRAVGTEFDVYKKIGGTVVTVVEGRVAVLPRSDTPAGEKPASEQVAEPPSDPSDARTLRSVANAGIFLSAGEQLLVTPTAMHKAEHPNIAIATSWTQRQLQFESASLPDVAEEFNRYNERQLVIEDPTLYEFHITGVFSSSDPASLVRFLRERPGVRVTETATEIRVSKTIL